MTEAARGAPIAWQGLGIQASCRFIPAPEARAHRRGAGWGGS